MVWKVSSAEFQVLNKYMGSGDFPNAKVLFFGNEEGLGGKELEANLVARVTAFGERDKEGNIVSSLDGRTKEKGYWEPNASDGGDKVHSLLYEQGLVSSPIRKAFSDGYFLPMAARICLTLEKQELDPTFWFKSKREYIEGDTNVINEYITKSLFRSREKGLSSALSDWRPLPRVKESARPPEYEYINWSKYKRAFNNPFEMQDISDSFTSYSGASRERAVMFANLLWKSQINVVIGFGDISTKATVLSKLFPGTIFSVVASTAFPSTKTLEGEIKLEGRDIKVLLLPFPDPRSRTWGSLPKEQKYSTMLALFAEMTEKKIAPHYRQ